MQANVCLWAPDSGDTAECSHVVVVDERPQVIIVAHDRDRNITRALRRYIETSTTWHTIQPTGDWRVTPVAGKRWISLSRVCRYVIAKTMMSALDNVVDRLGSVADSLIGQLCELTVAAWHEHDVISEDQYRIITDHLSRRYHSVVSFLSILNDIEYLDVPRELTAASGIVKLLRMAIDGKSKDELDNDVSVQSSKQLTTINIYNSALRVIPTLITAARILLPLISGVADVVEPYRRFQQADHNRFVKEQEHLDAASNTTQTREVIDAGGTIDGYDQVDANVAAEVRKLEQAHAGSTVRRSARQRDEQVVTQDMLNGFVNRHRQVMRAFNNVPRLKELFGSDVINAVQQVLDVERDEATYKTAMQFALNEIVTASSRHGWFAASIDAARNVGGVVNATAGMARVAEMGNMADLSMVNTTAIEYASGLLQQLVDNPDVTAAKYLADVASWDASARSLDLTLPEPMLLQLGGMSRQLHQSSTSIYNLHTQMYLNERGMLGVAWDNAKDIDRWKASLASNALEAVGASVYATGGVVLAPEIASAMLLKTAGDMIIGDSLQDVLSASFEQLYNCDGSATCTTLAELSGLATMTAAVSAATKKLGLNGISEMSDPTEVIHQMRGNQRAYHHPVEQIKRLVAGLSSVNDKIPDTAKQGVQKPFKKAYDAAKTAGSFISELMAQKPDYLDTKSWSAWVAIASAMPDIKTTKIPFEQWWSEGMKQWEELLSGNNLLRRMQSKLVHTYFTKPGQRAMLEHQVGKWAGGVLSDLAQTLQVLGETGDYTDARVKMQFDNLVTSMVEFAQYAHTTELGTFKPKNKQLQELEQRRLSMTVASLTDVHTFVDECNIDSDIPPRDLLLNRCTTHLQSSEAAAKKVASAFDNLPLNPTLGLVAAKLKTASGASNEMFWQFIQRAPVVLSHANVMDSKQVLSQPSIADLADMQLTPEAVAVLRDAFTGFRAPRKRDVSVAAISKGAPYLGDTLTSPEHDTTDGVNKLKRDITKILSHDLWIYQQRPRDEHQVQGHTPHIGALLHNMQAVNADTDGPAPSLLASPGNLVIQDLLLASPGYHDFTSETQGVNVRVVVDWITSVRFGQDINGKPEMERRGVAGWIELFDNAHARIMKSVRPLPAGYTFPSPSKTWDGFLSDMEVDISFDDQQYAMFEFMALRYPEAFDLACVTALAEAEKQWPQKQNGRHRVFMQTLQKYRSNAKSTTTTVYPPKSHGAVGALQNLHYQEATTTATKAVQVFDGMANVMEKSHPLDTLFEALLSPDGYMPAETSYRDYVDEYNIVRHLYTSGGAELEALRFASHEAVMANLTLADPDNGDEWMLEPLQRAKDLADAHSITQDSMVAVVKFTLDKRRTRLRERLRVKEGTDRLYEELLKSYYTAGAERDAENAVSSYGTSVAAYLCEADNLPEPSETVCDPPVRAALVAFADRMDMNTYNDVQHAYFDAVDAAMDVVDGQNEDARMVLAQEKALIAMGFAISVEFNRLGTYWRDNELRNQMMMGLYDRVSAFAQKHPDRAASIERGIALIPIAANANLNVAVTVFAALATSVGSTGRAEAIQSFTYMSEKAQGLLSLAKIRDASLQDTDPTLRRELQRLGYGLYNNFTPLQSAMAKWVNSKPVTSEQSKEILGCFGKEVCRGETMFPQERANSFVPALDRATRELINDINTVSQTLRDMVLTRSDDNADVQGGAVEMLSLFGITRMGAVKSQLGEKAVQQWKANHWRYYLDRKKDRSDENMVIPW